MLDFFLKKSRLFYTRKLLGIKIAWNKHYHGLTLLLLLQLWPLLQQLVHAVLVHHQPGLHPWPGHDIRLIVHVELCPTHPPLLAVFTLQLRSLPTNDSLLYEIILCKKKYIFNAYILVCMCILIGKTFRAIVQIWF